jgi:hypothetical protein
MTPRQEWHEEWSELLRAFAVGGLDRETSRELESHLRSCAECRSELAAVTAVLEPDEAPLSQSERANLHAALAGRLEDTAAVVPLSRPSQRPWLRRLAPALGAAALLLIGGVAVFQGLGGSGSAGSDAGGASAVTSKAGGAESASQLAGPGAPAWLGNLGRTSLDEVADLARSRPALDSVRKFARTEEAAEGGESPADLLAPQAPAKLRDSVRSCVGEISDQFEQANPLPVVGAQGRFEDKKVLFVGFVASSSGRRPNQLAVWALEPDSCAPLGYQASRLRGR